MIMYRKCPKGKFSQKNQGCEKRLIVFLFIHMIFWIRTQKHYFFIAKLYCEATLASPPKLRCNLAEMFLTCLKARLPGDFCRGNSVQFLSR